jgi:hypothetical protein
MKRILVGNSFVPYEEKKSVLTKDEALAESVNDEAKVEEVESVKEVKDEALAESLSTEPKSIEEMSVKELKLKCDEEGIEYKKSAKKAELLELLSPSEPEESEEL